MFVLSLDIENPPKKIASLTLTSHFCFCPSLLLNSLSLSSIPDNDDDPFQGLSNMLSTLSEELRRIENTQPDTGKTTIDNTTKKSSKWPLFLGVIIVIILCLLLLSVAIWMIILRRKKRQEEAREPEEVTFREKSDLPEGDGDNSNERNSKSGFSWNPLKSAKYSFRKGNKTGNNHTTSAVDKKEYTTIAASVGRKESEDFHDTEAAIEDDGITRVGGGAPVYQETTLA